MGGVCVERANSLNANLNMVSPPTEQENEYEPLPGSSTAFSNQRIVIDDGAYEYEDTAIACIGHGAFGTVYKGVDSNGCSVAIKKISTPNLKPNELNVMKSVRNRHLVGLIDICVKDSESTFLVMELCDSDLDHHLQRSIDGRLSSHDLRILIDNVARGYEALYQNRIVHRDIKPQNILVTYNRNLPSTFATVKITDFGISKMLDDEQGGPSAFLCNVAGTFNYMAPEVGANLLRTCQYDNKVDMWSIGCVLFQCITGNVPFDEGSLCRLFLNSAGGNYEAYEMPVVQACAEIQALVAALLEIDMRKRVSPVRFVEMAVDWSMRTRTVA